MVMTTRMALTAIAMVIARSLHLSDAARFSAGGKKVEYYRNHPLTGSTEHDRALIVIHGYGRNADDYYASAEQARDVFPGVGTNTLVVVPRFQTEKDTPQADELFWSEAGWSKGEDSLDGQAFSSFAVADGLLESISSRFPNVTEIVIAGHGAGAQFVQRYAGIGGTPDIRCEIRIRYVVANPGSYMFPTAERPHSTSGCDASNLFIGGQNEYISGDMGIDACPSGSSTIRDPEICSDATSSIGIQYNPYSSDLEVGETGTCVEKNVGKTNHRVTVTNNHGSAAAWLCEVSSPNAEYDRYKYGISDLPDALSYASLSIEEIQRNLVEREVFLLLGTADNSRTKSPTPDTSCEADAQGLHRYERGMNYRDNVKTLGCGARTSVTKVPGIGHNHRDMFTSPQGIMSLFIG